MRRFRDRRDAGQQLAAALAEHAHFDVVEALPRGGVPVAAPVADALGLPLDVLVVRKLGCPWQPELGVGAIGEGDVQIRNAALIDRLKITDRELSRVIEQESEVLEERLHRYRRGRPAVEVEGCRVVVVDDGLATGVTAKAAVEILRVRGAQSITFAAPVGPPRSVEALRHVADEVICLETPSDFAAVGQAYVDFGQTSDDEVVRILEAGRNGP